jgi:hypothetical protein
MTKLYPKNRQPYRQFLLQDSDHRLPTARVADAPFRLEGLQAYDSRRFSPLENAVQSNDFGAKKV